VCRTSYVHPQIVEWFADGSLGDRWDRASARGDRLLKPEERKLLRLLHSPRRGARKAA
jgi:DNA topoisomerase IB